VYTSRRSAVYFTVDPAGISTEFSGAITTLFCFTYTLDGVTAMPRGLHAGLCHAFLVVITTRSNRSQCKILTAPLFNFCTNKRLQLLTDEQVFTRGLSLIKLRFYVNTK